MGAALPFQYDRVDAVSIENMGQQQAGWGHRMGRVAVVANSQLWADGMPMPWLCSINPRTVIDCVAFARSRSQMSDPDRTSPELADQPVSGFPRVSGRNRNATRQRP
jgi:hypothetical protein